MGLLWQCSTQNAVNWQPITWVELHDWKVMVCVWWDHCSIIHFEILNCHHTLNADLYSHQLQCVHKNTPSHQWKNMIFPDNTRLHLARIMLEKLFDLGWSTPSTIFTRLYTKWFPSFHSLAKCSVWQKFSQEDQMKSFVENFLSSKQLKRNQ